MKISFSKQTKERAFKQLYEEYYAPFCLYAKRFVDDKETREDIVSDVFTSLWDKLDTDSFDLQSNTALAYIKMCVKNSCLNFLKHQEYEWSYAENIQKKAPVYETEPDSIYTLDELYRMLYETLNKLPENYRTVFIKSFFEGKTHTEIAEEMNMPVERVREILKISQEPVSLETPIGEEEDSHLGDFIQDDNVPVPADAAAFTLLKEQLDEVLGTLTEREQKVLRLRFGLDDSRARTLEEVGKEFNVTRERIRQIEAKALRKLRHPSRSRKLKDYLD